MSQVENDLRATITRAKEAYYSGNPFMSDKAYDEYVEKLKRLTGEEETVGFPTQSPDKIKHLYPARSLDKTKDPDRLYSIFNVHKDGSDEVVVMWKLDGSTVQLTYNDGKLQSAATRGDGFTGQNITENSFYIHNIPQRIDDKGLIVVRGEAIMTYETFRALNSNLPTGEQFENPRNLASASITLKDPNTLKQRNIEFSAFELVAHPKLQSMNFMQRLIWLKQNNFNPVQCALYSVSNLISSINMWITDAIFQPMPVDGLVLALNDTSYSDNLKGTDHHPHPLRGYAFKFQDEVETTTLLEIQWNTSRTGLLNPVAVFSPVRLEGTVVERASLHNLSYIKNLHLRIGDKIAVYKANKIIPQVSANLSPNKSPYTQTELKKLIPFCPSCYSIGKVHTSMGGVETVYCPYIKCQAKMVDLIAKFCSRSGMNIEGLSSTILNRFIIAGFINEFADIYRLDLHKDEILAMKGFNLPSYNKLWTAIQKSRTTSFIPFLTALSIPRVGYGQAKQLQKVFHTVNNFLSQFPYDYASIEFIGDITAESLTDWMIEQLKPDSELNHLLPYMIFSDESSSDDAPPVLRGMTFVVTGKIKSFSNRDALHKFIVDNGGVTSSTVS